MNRKETLQNHKKMAHRKDAKHAKKVKSLITEDTEGPRRTLRKDEGYSFYRNKVRSLATEGTEERQRLFIFQKQSQKPYHGGHRGATEGRQRLFIFFKIKVRCLITVDTEGPRGTLRKGKVYMFFKLSQKRVSEDTVDVLEESSKSLFVFSLRLCVFA